MSKNNRNISALSTNIDDSFTWRTHELNLLFKKIPKKSDCYQLPLIRANIALLYAHWEGFVKDATSFYLQHVALQGLKYKELQAQFVALCLKATINNFQANSIKKQAGAVEFILNNAEEKAKIPYKNEINTKSNLKFIVLEEILFIIGIDVSKFSRKKKLIDDLVDLRNGIVHGQNEPIKRTSCTQSTYYELYKTYYKDTIILLEQLKTEIENAAALEAYRN